MVHHLLAFTCTMSMTVESSSVLTLCDLGVSPEVLAVAGFGEDDISTLLTRLDAVPGLDELAGLRADVHAAQQSLRSAVSSARTEGDPRAHAAAAQTLAERKVVYDMARVELRDDLVGELPNAATLERIIGNRARMVPREFWILDLTERQWADLETALAQRHNPHVDLSAQQESMLLLAETSADVQAARQRLETRLASIQSAFGEALIE